MPSNELEHVFVTPVTSGPVHRAPNEAYRVWGLRYRSELPATRAYRAEWHVPGGERLPLLVGEASMKAFEKDFAQIIRAATAETVRTITDYLSERDLWPPGRLRFMDIGAGGGLSVLAVHQALPDALKDRVSWILVDPSKASLETAEQLMRQHNIACEIKMGSDTEVLKRMQPESVDLLLGVASVHHHSKIPFNLYAGVLKDGKFAVFGDWHHQAWTHPGFVYDMVSQFDDYPGKEEDLEGFLRKFPQALRRPPLPSHPTDRMAMRQIFRFWKAVATISQKEGLEGTPIWFLEGHRDVAAYVSAMHHNSLYTNSDALIDMGRLNDSLKTNPRQVLLDSSLLQVTVGQKSIKWPWI